MTKRTVEKQVRRKVMPKLQEAREADITESL